MRLNIAAGTAGRFEPGDESEVELVAIGGERGPRPERAGQWLPLDDREGANGALAEALTFSRIEPADRTSLIL